jgi:ribose 5-phosphate isomerase B
MIYLGADHRGFLFKEKIKEYLESQSLDFTDLGAKKYIKEDDYPLIAIKLAEEVVKIYGSLGVLACGSGAGACLAANKVNGARAGLGLNPRQITAARIEDDLNILCLSAEHLDENQNLLILKSFLETHFVAEERRVRRLRQISTYESQKC